MLHRVRHAMHTGSFEKFAGVIESDETFVGGEVRRNMHLSRRQEKIHGTGGTGKAIVHGASCSWRQDQENNVQSSGERREERKAKDASSVESKRMSAAGSHVYTDSLKSSYKDSRPSTCMK